MYKKGIIPLVAVAFLLVSGCQQAEKSASKTGETKKESHQETNDSSALKTTNDDSSETTESNNEESSVVEGSKHASTVHENSSQPNADSSRTAPTNVSVTKDTAALVMADYINGLTAAINTGQFSKVSYILKGSLYHDQQSLVSSLYKKGVKESWVDYSVVNFTKAGNSSDGPLYKIQTVETVSVIQPDGSQKTNKYNWMYTAVLVDNELYLTDIAKNGPITTVSKSGPTASASPSTSDTKALYLTKAEQKLLAESPADSENDFERQQQYAQNYKAWDDLLNEVYGVLKTQLSASEMSKLQADQRQWIKSRDAAAQATFNEEGGGTLSQAEQVRTLWEVTKDRCYFLINNYME